MKILIIYTLAIAMMVLVSCGGGKKDASPTVETMLTTGTWKLKTVTVDGVNKNDLFSNFSLSFTPTEFSSVNGAPVWPTSGTWAFASADKKTFTRNDGLVVTLNAITETELTLTLTWSKTTLGGGRVASIQGVHTFVLGK
jgi:hypothetical protein